VPLREAILLLLFLIAQLTAQAPTAWTTIGRDAQHSNRSTVAARHLDSIAWSTPVDTVLAGTPGTLLVHYGSPLITAANTVIVPVRTSLADTFEIQARSGVDGTLKYTLSTDYAPPAHSWVPSYSPGLTARNRLYYACAGGTVCFRDTPDANTGTTGRIAFYGTALYDANTAAFNSTVRVSTPIVGDRYGNIYFGFEVSGANPASLSSGLARIGVNGVGTWVSAATAAADPSMNRVQMNSAPALSIDHLTVYFPVASGNSAAGYLVALNSSNLSPLARVLLMDPRSGVPARVSWNSTASPVIGLDGDVYFGVLESTFGTNNARGWMLHFNGALSQTKTPAAFGWDSNASIVPRAAVPGYGGTSAYLILTKYNNYAGIGSGDGLNRVALLDPNAMMIDPVTGATVMNVVATVDGPTPDGPAPEVREWCINSAAIDLVGKAAMVNSEDGKLYRWDFTTNTLSEAITLTPGVAEAYTPTLIGPDGTVYAINDALLFAVR
jgi:hypothetical protein